MRTLLRALALVMALSLAGAYIWNSTKVPSSTEQAPLPELTQVQSANTPRKVIVPSVLTATTKSGRIYFKEGWVDLTKIKAPSGSNVEADLIPYEDNSVDRSTMRSAFENSSLVDIYLNAQPDSNDKMLNIDNSTLDPPSVQPDSLMMSSKIGIVTPPILPAQLSSSTKSGKITPIVIQGSEKGNPVAKSINANNIMPGTKSIGALIRQQEEKKITPQVLLPGTKFRALPPPKPATTEKQKKKISPTQIMPGTKSAPQHWKKGDAPSTKVNF